MSFRSCNSCWNLPCTCGAEYKHLSLGELKKLRAGLKDVSRVLAELILEKQDEQDSWSGPGNQ